MRVVYMGTPDFAVNTLEIMVEAGYEVALVVTQPDKAKGRGKKLAYTPVKETALRYGLPVAQPDNVGREAFVKQLEEIAPDVIVVVAFGQILPEAVLKIPRLGCINVHASLLPAYRGAAPIQWAVIDGLKETGVTTMYMEKGLDTGDIICQSVVPIASDETGGSLFDKLAAEGAVLLLHTLELLGQGAAVRRKQDDSQSSYAKMLTKDMGKLDFSRPAVELERLIRGLNPWPSAYTKVNGKTLKIYQAGLLEGEAAEEMIKANQIVSPSPGMVIAVDKKSFTVLCGSGALQVTNLQLEGKKRMDASAFLLGFDMQVGITLHA